MLQIIEENRKRTPGENFAQAISGVTNAASGFLQQQQRQQAAQKLGIDPEILQLPEAQAEYFKNKFSGENKNAKFAQDMQIEQRDYDIVKQTFGKKFADIWKAAPVGGKTELVKYGMDALSRGENLENLLKDVTVPQEQENLGMQESQEIPQIKNGQVPENFKWPDYSKRPFGYNTKEWAEERKSWRKENAPIFQENKTRLASNSRDELGIKKLTKLSDKLPEGLERIIINPETGEPYALAQLSGKVSPEVQEWIKETARFQNRAKDAFGSRVTNFDLVSYMKQFPGLLNTKEGRKRILKMMEINNKLDQLYEKSLRGVYQKYGLSGIPQEEADRLATGFIKDETEKLRNEYLGLDEENQQIGSNEEQQGLSGKMIDVMGPDGKLYEIDEREVEQLPEGFRIK